MARKNTPSNESFLEEAFTYLTCAVESDKSGNKMNETIDLYNKSLENFRLAARLEQNESKRTLLETKIQEYSRRVDEIKIAQSLPDVPTNIPPRPLTIEEQEINRLYSEAMNLDEKGQKTQALELYMAGAEMQLAFLKRLEERSRETVLIAKMKREVSSVLNHIEDLKRGITKAPQQRSGSRAPSPPHTTGSPKCPSPAVRNTSHSKATGGLSPEEIEALRFSSTVNGRVFLPWLDSDIEETFHYSEKWCDPEGLLPLSEKQCQYVDEWKRPSEIFPAADLSMIKRITPDSITQDLVTDCSFIASLCITAAFEAKFRKQLITKIIYPQNSQGIPIYNPSGKYMVKLWVNGVARKVLVDDRLPIDRRDNRPLCSMSSVDGELWVSIIEKAYMKVNGGYDFPGSNSGIDLFSLTGWIPEGIPLENIQRGSDEFRSTWQRLLSAHNFGDCLITVNTGNLGSANDTEEERTGLVSCHAYAVLDVRDVQNYDGALPAGMAENNSLKMLKLKNPWARRTWKGMFSRTDQQHWTSYLQRELNYDPVGAQRQDDGVFWMEFGILCKFFNNLQLNWNPELFSYRSVVHSLWLAKVGPKNDSYNVGENPQYTLAISRSNQNSEATILSPSAASPTVWVLLSRHVLFKEATPKEGDFLTLHVYNESDGMRVFYPSKAMIRGTYSNNPHCLVSFEVPAFRGDATEAKNKTQLYTLVLSQYEKTRDVSYTLNVFCTSPFTLYHTPPLPEHCQRFKGAWTSTTAGGASGRATYMNNPQYAVTITSATSKVHIQLQAPKELSIHVGLVLGQKPEGAEVLSSGSYRSGFCFAAGELPAGIYTLVVSTYQPLELGAYILSVYSSSSCLTCLQVPPEGDGMTQQDFEGAWSFSDGTAVGCSNFGNYIRNPFFQLSCSTRTEVVARLCCTLQEHSAFPALNITMYKPDPLNGKISRNSTPKSPSAVATSNEGVYTDSKSGVVLKTSVDSGKYYIAISTFQPQEAPYRLVVFSLPNCSVTPLYGDKYISD